ncbi:PQQ-binding-like beta-propeller repeat protein [Paractinoplanes rhizophilus]|uniref:PQQ-binding-like beta-propeller repeat protein n=1 Tax=Paractinoplanes rhizophilus TaxID=1416877 RepID=A0ABW2I0J7_9ACTN
MRARTLAAVLSLTLAVAPATPAHAVALPAWDHPGYDAEDSYYNPHETAINLGTIAGLTRRWSVPLRKRPGGACAGFSKPLVAGGRVIVTDQLGIGAYLPLTGAPAWRFTWPDPLDTETPYLAADGSTLIAATSGCNSQSDPDGIIFAVDLTTGRLRWRADPDVPVYSLAVDKGMAVIAGVSPSDEQAVIAYRVADGRVAWQKPGYDSSGVSANGRLLVTNARSTSAVSIISGVPLWTKKAVWRAEAATPASDRFLVTNGESLSAVSAAFGALLWTAPAAASTLLATDGRRVYRAAGNTVEALNAANGRRLWSRSLPKEAGQPVRAGGLLYVGGPILSPATGAVLRPTTAGPSIVTGGRLYTANQGILSSYGT